MGEEEVLRRKNYVLYNISRRYLQVSRIPKSPPAAVTIMVKVDFTDDELEKKLEELDNKSDWEEECKWCLNPAMLHRQPCETEKEKDYEKIVKLWKEYRKRMKKIREEKKKEKKIEKVG